MLVMARPSRSFLDILLDLGVSDSDIRDLLKREHAPAWLNDPSECGENEAGYAWIVQPASFGTGRDRERQICNLLLARLINRFGSNTMFFSGFGCYLYFTLANGNVMHFLCTQLQRPEHGH